MRRFGSMTVVVTLMTIVGFSSVGVASAADMCMHQFGSHQKVGDAGGMQDWSVTDLKKSSDTAPGYPLAGQLWEATASVMATSGAVTPLIPNFSAATAGGDSYPVLWQLASPQGISAATLTQGQTATGKLYFDATGGVPVSVRYDNGTPTPLMWCCGEMMMKMPMDECTCCADMGSCPCCAGKM